MDIAGKRNGLTQDTSRPRPRFIRFQKPAGPSCGSTPTAASTVWAGASAITVYTMPPPDQVMDRWSGSETRTACPFTVVRCQPASRAARLPCCSKTEITDKPSE